MPNIYLNAGEDLTGFEKRFVFIDGNGDAVKPADGGDATGVLTAGAVTGEQVTISINSTTAVEVDGVLPARRMMATTSEGKCRVAQQGEFAHGTSSEDADNETVEIGVELQRFGVVSGPVSANGEPVVELTGPKHSDGTSMFTPSQFPVGMPMIFPGVGDNVVTGARLDNTKQNGVQSTVIEAKEIETRYVEDIWLVGGVVQWEGAVYGDWFDYSVKAPATDGVAAAAGTGAYAKIDVGGGNHIWVPAGTAGSLGDDWDIDLYETLNENVSFTKAVPVPAVDGDGFFDYSDGVLSLNATKTGMWNLFDFELRLSRLAPNNMILGDGQINLRATSVPARCNRAQWRHVITVNNSTVKTLSVVWSMQMARAHSS